ncbi:MAG TPA: KH domain-containing protein [Candidatus Woesebacteria bacterium]|nr:KH domain-containing protein [Candidatus Woesebacteria bacterium]HRS23110.1 KH domain-containing protein [Candidatus Woesebacteria bacterium]HRT40221.1 KH domain-containing protein [Candidatus Woesebacteria bacterium]
MNQLQQTLEYILQSIIDNPEGVEVETKEQDNFTNLIISAPKEKIGQIIGKQGKIIKAIRIILGISYPNTRFNLEIKE